MWVMHCICAWLLTSIFGIVAVLIQVSIKENLERKNYMQVWRCESEMTARMMSRFPKTVIKYMDRNRQRRRGCRSGLSVSPRRKNSEISVWFLGSTLLDLKGKWHEKKRKWMVPRGEAPASTGNLLEMLIVGVTPDVVLINTGGNIQKSKF